ncbi:uncharacterized protein METZ01_LOCUS396364 [marine metagenome]|uniref:Uncharacterized protein n=1 Tax=marine metagenome TaxID=408172 RepID=A0A382VAP0_9ZZZZ
MKQYLIGMLTGSIMVTSIFFFMGQTNYNLKSWEARPEKSNDEIFSLLKDIQVEIKDGINCEGGYVEYVTRGIKVDCD